ncbi:kinase-like protein [Peniophora sp. CONT]|nr:kinase-like protein [Peniophora sp. CONT]
MEATPLTAPSGRSYQPQTAKCISQGSYGTIYKCKAHEGTAPLPGFVALKVVSWDRPGLDEEIVLSERNVLDSITPHAGIVKLLDSWVDGDGHKLYMVFDWFERGDLHEYSKTHRIDEATQWHLHQQVLSVLEHIHSQGYAHVDVKPENLLVVDVNPLKVAFTDFGSARRIRELGNGPVRVHTACERSVPFTSTITDLYDALLRCP